MTELRIVRSRRKTLALQVLPTGEIVARAPLRLPERDIHAFAEQHAAWLEAAVARARAGSRAAQRAGILSETELQRLRTAARADLTERVTRLAARMGVDFAGITIRAQRTRWGSCSARGSLSFNCLLMLAPPEVREYVAVHELCHRKQMNHSAAFWREVASCLPDYAAQRAWLREHGPALLGRLPETLKILWKYVPICGKISKISAAR